MALFVYRMQKFDMPPHNPNHRTYFPNTCCILQPNEAMCKILGMHSLILCIYGNSFSLLYNQTTFLLMTYTCINVVVMSLPTNICYSDIFLRRVQFSFYYFQMCYLIKNNFGVDISALSFNAWLFQTNYGVQKLQYYLSSSLNVKYH